MADPVVVRSGALVGRRVIDERGVDHGPVIDVRVVQDGPVTDGTKARLRVDGLVVGAGGVGERLGLLRRRVHGPWLLKAIAAVLSREARYVPWEAVAEVPSGDDEPVRIVAPPGGELTERP